MQLEHVGLNHLSLGAQGARRRRRPAARAPGAARWTRIARRDRALPLELDPRRSARSPSYYLHYYYLTGRVLAAAARGAAPAPRRSWRSRPGCSSCTRTRRSTRSRSCSRSAGGRSTATRRRRSIASLHAGTGDVQVVNVRNDGAIPNLPDDAVVEVSARVDRDGAHPLPVDPLAPEMLGLVAAREGLRAAHDRGGDDRRPRRRAAGVAGEPARAATTTRPARCWTRCSRRTAATCRGSSPADRIGAEALSRPGSSVGVAPGSSRAPRPRPRAPASPSRNTFSMKYTDSRRPAASATGNDIRVGSSRSAYSTATGRRESDGLEELVVGHRRVLHLAPDALGLQGVAHDLVRARRRTPPGRSPGGSCRSSIG